MESDNKSLTLKEQLTLPLTPTVISEWQEGLPVKDRLIALLARDLDFHKHNSTYATHVIHSFPAKFPPQLPRLFIEHLTKPGDVILDPMVGSGTSLLEAYLAGRRAIGLDIDPLALRIASAKVQHLNAEHVLQTMHTILKKVEQNLQGQDESSFRVEFESHFDEETQKFIDYWFAPDVYKTLFHLKKEIQEIQELSLRIFFEVAFSSLIITKSGGVSFALDLAHTRPHRAKIVYDKQGNEILREDFKNISPARLKLLTKTLRPVLSEFEKRVRTNLRGEFGKNEQNTHPNIISGNAQNLPLRDETVDLVVTSPPYASNAIDYMRAHKFALIWLGFPLSLLSKYRNQYIGHDGMENASNLTFPTTVQHILEMLQEKDKKKMSAVRRYYGEMNNVLKEIYRVLRPGKVAVLVVGTSVIRGIDIQISDCLAEIGKQVGFDVPAIGVRNLDRNRRMLPIGKDHDANSQIQQRMNQEFVIGFYKPSKEE
jgi:DNA modification methylase